MTASCALWVFQAGCFSGELATGSLPEWMTAVVTVLALAAAVYAGIAATSAARSARDQASAGTAALAVGQAQATSAAETVAYARDQAQAAMDSVTHAQAAAESARSQAEAAQKAFEADARVREEAQARLVYSEVGASTYVAKGTVLTGEDKHWERTVWDESMLSKWEATDRTGQPNRNRQTTKDAVKIAVHVHNLSAEIISQVRLFFYHPVTDERSKVDKFTSIVPPQKERVYYVVIPVPEGTNIYASQPESHFASWVQVVEFQDAVGVWWSRTGSAPIRKLE